MGTFVNFVWVTIGKNFFNDHISAKEEDKELYLAGMVIRKCNEHVQVVLIRNYARLLFF